LTTEVDILKTVICLVSKSIPDHFVCENNFFDRLGRKVDPVHAVDSLPNSEI